MKNYIWKYNEFEKNSLNFRESIFTLSNTYMGVRGVEDELSVGSLPGLYIAGLFDKSEGLVSEIINFPSFFEMYFITDGEKFSLDTCEILDYSRCLNMKDGTVERTVTLKTEYGKQILLESKRFLSFYDINCGALHVNLTALNFSGELQIISEYDASLLSREGCYGYEEEVKHYNTICINNQFEDNFYTRLKIRDSDIFVDISCYIDCEGTRILKRRRKVFGDKVTEILNIEVNENQKVGINKYFVVIDSRDVKVEALKELCISKLERIKGNGFEVEFERSAKLLELKWNNCDVSIEGDDESDLELRFNIFQLIGLGNENNSKFAIGAKGLSTEHYGGHYFWDTEAYLLQFYINTQPAVAKNLLKFRFNTLERAKKRAKAKGYEGCLWPWQSDAEGEEGIRQTVAENGVIARRHILDQYHVVSDVAFACFKYLYRTGDEYFFRRNLMPIIIESLRFWKSFLLKHNAEDVEQYNIPKVMGPDEYHINVKDNYYTNYLTKVVFEEFSKYIDAADEKQLYDIALDNKIKDEEIVELRKIGGRIYIPEAKDGVFEQFSGYFDLQNLIVKEFNEKGFPTYPDPEVGKGLPDTERQDAIQLHATQTQLIKQTDMLFAMCQNLEGFTEESIRINFDYYIQRTLHFSSLSPGANAVVGAMCGKTDEAYKLFKLALHMDLHDIKGETWTGLHTACHGGAYQAAVEGFAGIRGERDFLVVAPKLPQAWQSIAFPLIYKGLRLYIKMTPGGTTITSGSSGKMTVKFYGNIQKFDVCMGKIIFLKKQG